MKRFFVFATFLIFLIFASIYWYIFNYPQGSISSFESKDTDQVLYINYKGQEFIRLAPFNVLGKFEPKLENSKDTKDIQPKYEHIFADSNLKVSKKGYSVSPFGAKKTVEYVSENGNNVYTTISFKNKVYIAWQVNNLQNSDSMQEIWLAIQFVNIKEPKLSDGMFTFIHKSTNCKGVVTFENNGCNVDFREDWGILFFKCEPSNTLNIGFSVQCF